MHSAKIGKKSFFSIGAIITTCFFLFAFSTTSTGQTKTITGKVIASDTKESIPGVTISIKGTTRGTLTDGMGNFTIQVEASDQLLVFSFIGYANQEVPINNQQVINVTLEQENKALDEVVVIGYGSQRVKDLTAPIVTVKGEELSKQVSSNPMQALQGQVSGIQIINSGIPGSSSSVKIRGVGSIGDYANPLYIVDGVFVDNIDFLSTNDIEDLTVLKDASASAIYGVRAANGVILVTTKKGKTDKPVVSYDGYYGLQVPVNIMPMATKNQYVTLMNEANINAIGYVPKDPSSYPTSTDWYKELVRNAAIQSHNIGISGGTEKSSYSFGGNYYFQQGIMATNNDYERFNIRGRLEEKVTKYLKIGVNTVVSTYDKQIPNDGAFFGAYVNPPVYPVYDLNNAAAYPVKFASPQQYNFGNQYGNPVAAAYYNNNYEKGTKLVFSAFTEFNLEPV